MPPRKRSKRRSSQESEKMSNQAQARSPEVDKLSCVQDNQQSQQAAEVEELVVGVDDPLQMSYRTGTSCTSQVTLHLRHSRIWIQVMRTHRTQGTAGTQKGKCKGKSSRERLHVSK